MEPKPFTDEEKAHIDKGIDEFFSTTVRNGRYLAERLGVGEDIGILMEMWYGISVGIHRIHQAIIAQQIPPKESAEIAEARRLWIEHVKRDHEGEEPWKE